MFTDRLRLTDRGRCSRAARPTPRCSRAAPSTARPPCMARGRSLDALAKSRKPPQRNDGQVCHSSVAMRQPPPAAAVTLWHRRCCPSRIRGPHRLPVSPWPRACPCITGPGAAARPPLRKEKGLPCAQQRRSLAPSARDGAAATESRRTALLGSRAELPVTRAVHCLPATRSSQAAKLQNTPIDLEATAPPGNSHHLTKQVRPPSSYLRRTDSFLPSSRE